VLLLLAALVASCAFDGRDAAPGDPDQAVAACTPSDCVVVDLAVSPEKAPVLTDLAKAFNASATKVGQRRIVIRPREKASGAAAEQLAAGWADRADDPRPVLWSPAARAWGAILDDELASRGRPPMAGAPTSVMSSPLVIAMPRRMAEALGYPARAVGWADVLSLASDPRGWAAFGHPEWGMFRLGKTNPRFSTSGLHAFIAQHYAAVGRTAGLTADDLDAPAVQAFNRAVESSVVHYGDTTLTFLNNWHRADQQGNPYRYASAVAVEEKSVIDYNRGNPDGIDDPGEVPRPPREPLVALYPDTGTIFSDSPFYVLDADWVTADQRAAARAFTAFAQSPAGEDRITRAGFRVGDGLTPVSAEATPGTSDRPRPVTTLELPSGAVLRKMLDTWEAQRKGARVMVLVDVSGSMAEEAAAGRTKLALARAAVDESLAMFRGDDVVGLRELSTGLGPAQNQDMIDLAPMAPIGDQRDRLRAETANLRPANGTPLYAVTLASVREMMAGFDPARINAVVLLTDGRNEDGDTADDKKQRDDLLRVLVNQTQGDSGRPLRLFTIGYGAAADAVVLKDLAESTNGRYYSATADPTTIAKVFVQVVSNF
jgi:Ca-activated chloride channel family protein